MPDYLSSALPSALPSADWPTLKRRAALLNGLRDFFHKRGFVEVETPALSADVAVDRHLDAFSSILADDPRRPQEGRRLWLQTSPEFHMKRLLAAGADAIFQVAKAFRNGERGPLHNPEFTLVEWYRRGDDMRAAMALLADLAQQMLATGPATLVSYRQAFQRHASVDPFQASIAELRQAAASRGVSIPRGFETADHDAWLDLLLVELVQPNLGLSAPAIVYDFPSSQAALSRVRPGDPPVAERFELFVRGVELANGYHELLDADELRRRIAEANRQREADGKPALPESNRLLEAMDHGLPACAGVALGFDRLAMLAFEASSLDAVMAFPIDRA